MLQTSIYVTNYEQYESIATTSQQFGKSTFSLFRSKNSKFSSSKTFLSQNNLNERKTNFHLVPEYNNSNKNSQNNSSSNNNSNGSKGKNKMSKYSTFLTASPSSLSYRLTSSSSTNSSISTTTA